MLVNSLNQTKSSFSHVFAHENDEVTAIYGGLNYSNVIYYAYDTINGVPPLSFKSNGEAIEDYTIEGNTLQDGTPTPEAPVDVQGVGVKTGNLSPIAQWENVATDTRYPFQASLRVMASTSEDKKDILSTGRYSLTINNFTSGVIVLKHNGQTRDLVILRQEVEFDEPTSITVSFYVEKYDPREVSGIVIRDIMLNLGPTALPYEPYGYKLPLTVNGTEYPIYLGDVQTTRRIKKLVLKGDDTETYTSAYSGDNRFFTYALGSSGYDAIISTHFTRADISSTSTNVGVRIVGGIELRIRPENVRGMTVDGFKAWLSAQYAAGTPVTVWYVLETPETAVVNEPLQKIGNYADTINYIQSGIAIPTINGTNTLAISTTVSPSNVEATGRIKRIIEGS